MNTFKMRQLILVPMIVLAVNACAKRDSDFNKKTPGAADKANPTDAGTGTENKLVQGADGALTYALSCNNPLKIAVPTGSQAITLDELIKDSNKGTYTLTTTEYFSETAVKEGEAPEQIAAQGNEFKTPEAFAAAVTDEKKINITCHTTKPVEGKELRIRGSMDFANSFSAADGKGKVLRQDTFVALNGKLTTTTTLYAGSVDLKESLGPAHAEALNLLIFKNSKTNDVTIKQQMNRTGKDGKTIGVWMAATYTLNADPKSDVADATDATATATTETAAPAVEKSADSSRSDINDKEK